MRPPARLRLAITLFALLAFALQGYLTQTHIHVQGTGTAAEFKLAGQADPAGTPGKAPAKDDSSNCPICQSVIHAGSFVTPSQVALYLPTLAIGIVALVVESVKATNAASHSWQGRAPPIS